MKLGILAAACDCMMRRDASTRLSKKKRFFKFIDPQPRTIFGHTAFFICPAQILKYASHSQYFSVLQSGISLPYRVHAFLRAS